MDIHEKIEEIRQKPEHIRMNYVIFCVILSMLLLIVFWGFSIKSTLSPKIDDAPTAETCSNNSQTCKMPEEQTFEKALDPINQSNETSGSVTNLALPKD